MARRDRHGMAVSPEAVRAGARAAPGTSAGGGRRADGLIAIALVLLVLATGALGIAAAALVALLLLLARFAWSGAAALARRSRRSRPAGGRARGAVRRGARVTTLAALLILVAASVSCARAVAGRSDSSVAIQIVEWLRDNGARAIVSNVERIYYSLAAPARGGPALVRLPSPGVAGRTTARGASRSGPRNVRAAIHPRLAREGVWRPTQRRFSRGSAPLLITTLRSDPSYPRVVAGLAWIDPRRATVALYPGLKEPPGGGLARVPASKRARLLATFNSGFKHADSGGGFFAGGRLVEPLVRGQGTVIGMRGGRVDVRSWRGGARPGPGVVFARQNLPLIVAGHRPAAGLGDSSRWGATLGNSVLVWRSGLGVDRHGHLIYAAADYQSARGLAMLLVRAGAVRAVEFDINSYWVSFNVFARPAGRGASKLLPDMTRPATRYLTPDDRDFFAVYARR